jgi:tetratricopeptide (TPR) repeat protein
MFRTICILLAFVVSASLGAKASAQINSLNDLLERVRQDATQQDQIEQPEAEKEPESETTPEIEPAPDTDIPAEPEIPPDDSDIPAAPEVDIPVVEDEKRAKDLTIRSDEDRTRILNELFDNLKIQPDAESGHLVAEEIWAVFMQSRSATVDFLLLRGITAQKRGDLKLARRMYNHVLRLQPEYAEGWSRSGRLAIDEKDLSRAAKDTAQSLIYEPRHFYALWTLGNILETLGKQEEALEVYEEAAKLYPKHKEINERVEFLKADVQGKAL